MTWIAKWEANPTPFQEHLDRAEDNQKYFLLEVS